MSKWQAFQADVLDTVRQYQGYFDFFEQIGSVSDSRPDLLARVTREEKKEVWILDAKAKGEIDDADQERMEKYVSQIRTNPVDIGLDFSELESHEIRKIYVGKSSNLVNKAEWVNVNALHQFLQRELLYTETNEIVRDIAKMMKNRELSQQQARMLYESIEPYRESLNSTMDVLESMEKRYTGLELQTGTASIEGVDVPVDATLVHEGNNKIFLIDIPYSRRAIEGIRDKIDLIQEEIVGNNSEIFYAAVNRFESTDEDLIYAPGELEKEIRREAGIIDAGTVADIFTPKIPVSKTVEPGKAFLSTESRIEFRLEVRVFSDNKVRVEAVMPEEAISELKNRLINSRRQLGEFSGNRFTLEFQIEKGMKIRESDQDFESFRKSIESSFGPSVNPVLGRIYSEDA